MRPVLAGDVFALARCLQAVPAEARRGLCQRLIAQTEGADRFRKRFSVLHAEWGNGSLLGRVRHLDLGVPAGPGFQSRDFCACLVLGLEELERWRAIKQERSGREALAVATGSIFLIGN